MRVLSAILLHCKLCSFYLPFTKNNNLHALREIFQSPRENLNIEDAFAECNWWLGATVGS